MKAYVGGGWHVKHLTDRVIEIQKDDVAYRELTGGDGFVRVRGEVGISRDALISRALEVANMNDADIAKRISAQLIPSKQSIYEFALQSAKLTEPMQTGEEPEVIGQKKA